MQKEFPSPKMILFPNKSKCNCAKTALLFIKKRCHNAHKTLLDVKKEVSWYKKDSPDEKRKCHGESVKCHGVSVKLTVKKGSVTKRA
jgi:hypothetical protein